MLRVKVAGAGSCHLGEPVEDAPNGGRVKEGHGSFDQGTEAVAVDDPTADRTKD